MGIIIFEEDSVDSSAKMVSQWCLRNKGNYAFMDCVYGITNSYGHDDASSKANYTRNRMDNIIRLRDEIVSRSMLRWSDYLFMVDADVMLTNGNVLLFLMEQLRKHDGGAIAPLLNCTSLPLYSNFWDDMTVKGSPSQTDRYLGISHANNIGTFKTTAIQTVILFHLNLWKSGSISFQRPMNATHINDDITNLAMNARLHNMTLLVNNEQLFGYFPGPIHSEKNGYYIEKNTFINLLFHFVLYNNYEKPKGLGYDPDLKQLDDDEYKYLKMNVDEVVVINLERRKNRKNIIQYLMNLMNISFRFFPAVDGNSIDNDFLLKANITPLRNYSDPFHKRRITFGEIGCFLSHFLIWKDMMERGLKRILVLEDDIKCTSEFPYVVNDLLSEADELYPGWEFFYLGRKRMSSDKEHFLKGSRNILIPNYSYRTTGYILSSVGAERLIKENPLEKIMALDEFIPIMYGKNPHKEWENYFPGGGNLKAIACSPVIVQPSHFRGEKDYFSDTEFSNSI